MLDHPSSLLNRHVLLGVTGSIAAYKAVDLVRRLREAGAEVRVVMTAGAQSFVTPLTFQAVSGNPVSCAHLDGDTESSMGHIALARWADLLVIAPASANTLARLAHGLAGDLLMDICLASEAPVLVAPAMNRYMWTHPATVENVRILRRRGLTFQGPDSGVQACGEVGEGRMSEAAAILAAVDRHFAAAGALSGQQIVITAGPTHEPIDPVRFIGNRSSGKMGYAIAAAAVAAGATVTLVSGPVSVEASAAVDVIQVATAAEMRAAVFERVEQCDIFIAAAAVADYRPIAVETQKIKKDSGELALQLERTEDILAGVTGLAQPPFTVGFAAETIDLEVYARKKLSDKGLDMIAANLVGEGRGFDRDDNALEVFWLDGGASLPLAAKTVLAGELIQIIAKRYHERHSA